MPKFIDYHAQMPQMPPEAVQQFTETIKAGKPDQFGVVPLNIFMGTGGQAYCLTEAPSADAVCQAHAAIRVNIAKEDVQEVQSLV